MRPRPRGALDRIRHRFSFGRIWGRGGVPQSARDKRPGRFFIFVDIYDRALSEEEIGQLLSSVDANTVLGARNTAIIWLMLDTGLRLSEAASLKERDVHIDDQYQKVMGKGNKERMISFGIGCKSVLQHYRLHFRGAPVHDSVDSFFLSIDGYPMTANAIRCFVKRLAVTSGVRRLHPHLLRHTYATRFLLNGGDIYTLKHNLGHATLAMVQNYLHVSNETAAVRSRGFSPMDRTNVEDNRKFRHSFTQSNGMNGHIYPKVGSRRRPKYRAGNRSR